VVDGDLAWSKEFGRSGIRHALSNAIDDATPGLVDRLASDPSAYLQLLTITQLASDEADELLRETVIAARHARLSWEQIGSALGLSRQEALLRFGPKMPESLAQDDQSNAIVPTVGATSITGGLGYPPIGTRVGGALDELAQLQRAGNYGWHAVSYSGGYFTVQFDTQQWEHVTTTGKTPPGDGWQRVSRFAFWVYWARPTGLPILPGNPEPKAFYSEGKLKRALLRNEAARQQGAAAGTGTVNDSVGQVIGAAARLLDSF
jgi:hypothetical protein